MAYFGVLKSPINMREIKENLKVLSAYYNDDTALKLLVTSLPQIGGQLDIIFSAPGQKFAADRIQYMIEELQNGLEMLDEEKIDKSFFCTEEGYDLVHKSFSAAARTRQREKLKLFAKILKGASVIHSEHHDPELYLKVVEEISTQEMEIALIMYDVKVRKTKQEMGRDEDWYPSQYPQFTKCEFDIAFVRLVKSGLIKPMIGRHDGGGSYETTLLLHNFLEFIGANGGSQE